MAGWLQAALKAVIPHVGDILTAAKPAFTRREALPAANQDLVQQQIAELQAAVSQNAANVRELATQLQATVAAIEQAASATQASLRRSMVFSIAAFVFSTVALCAAVLVVLIFRP